MSVNDDLPYLAREMEIIRQAVARRQPVLGICLGAQLIASALGATVRRNPAKEIGWFDLRFTEPPRPIRSFDGLSAETVFHWHGETFDLPPGAELLASSDLCRNQAFRVGESCLRTPVPPGGDAGDDRGLVRAGRELRRCARTGVGDRPAFNAPRLAELSAQVFGNWSEMVQFRR